MASGSELMPAARSSVWRAATLSDEGSSKLSEPAFMEPATGPPTTPASAANSSVAAKTRLGRALTRRAIAASIGASLGVDDGVPLGGGVFERRGHELGVPAVVKRRQLPPPHVHELRALVDVGGAVARADRVDPLDRDARVPWRALDQQ